MTGVVNTNKLKPCPCCGSHASLVYDSDDGFQIYCDNCCITTETDDDREKLIMAWNKRPRD